MSAADPFWSRELPIKVTGATLLATATSLAAVFVASKIIGLVTYKPKQPGPETPEKGNPADAIELFPVGGLERLISPFSAKLESFLRLSGLPFRKSTASFDAGPKGKIPFIVHGPHIIGDTQLIIEYLRRTYSGQPGIKLVPDVAPGLKWQAVALQRMVDEHMYWGLVTPKWTWDDCYARLLKTDMFDKFIPGMLQPLLKPALRRTIAEEAWGAGPARHARRDFLAMLDEDVAALAGALGSHKFMLGSPEPTTLDCCVFGMLDKLLEPEVIPEVAAVVAAYPSLVEYTKRMRALVEATPGPMQADK